MRSSTCSQGTVFTLPSSTSLPRRSSSADHSAWASGSSAPSSKLSTEDCGQPRSPAPAHGQRTPGRSKPPPLAAGLLLEGARGKTKALEFQRKSAKLQGFRMVGETGFEPATPWSRTKARERPGVTSGSQPLVNTQISGAGPVQPSHQVRVGTKDFAATLLLRPTPVPPPVDRRPVGGLTGACALARSGWGGAGGGARVGVPAETAGGDGAVCGGEGQPRHAAGGRVHLRAYLAPHGRSAWAVVYLKGLRGLSTRLAHCSAGACQRSSSAPPLLPSPPTWPLSRLYAYAARSRSTCSRKATSPRTSRIGNLTLQRDGAHPASPRPSGAPARRATSSSTSLIDSWSVHSP